MVRLAVVRPCKGSSGTEVLPEERLELVLEVAARRLGSAGMSVTDARALLIVEGEPRVTLYPSGRMLVHTDDLDMARSRAQLVLDLATEYP